MTKSNQTLAKTSTKIKQPTIIKIGPNDSVAVYTQYGDHGRRTGREILITPCHKQTGLPLIKNNQNFSISDLLSSRAIILNDAPHCYSEIMHLMSRETEMSKAIRDIYRAFGINSKNGGLRLIIKLIEKEVICLEEQAYNATNKESTTRLPRRNT
jgi:hypothetical protein